jgi:hypothetical protein
VVALPAAHVERPHAVGAHVAEGHRVAGRDRGRVLMPVRIPWAQILRTRLFEAELFAERTRRTGSRLPGYSLGIAYALYEAGHERRGGRLCGIEPAARSVGNGVNDLKPMHAPKLIAADESGGRQGSEAKDRRISL